ncbi:hypothetical protein [Marinobacter sp. F3R08]|uniref:hypothetical protein n=1 Tax=Marinobacter sp. F3R08 TaxID=2841559 RepID=UPI001C09ABBF|nr:hypothetical protein [Marinobacter sp. F3R08]MBU2955025.1 hypothetical protein [Marinobacter sp. F3R08]
MQDAHTYCRIQGLRLVFILALGLVSLPSHSADTASASLFCESASCLIFPDVTSDGGPEGGVSDGSHLRDIILHPDSILADSRGFSGQVPCASFPVMPQAPPLT